MWGKWTGMVGGEGRAATMRDTGVCGRSGGEERRVMGTRRLASRGGGGGGGGGGAAGGWGVCAIGGVVLLVMGCTPTKRYAVMSFFFDGVPDPDAALKAGAAVRGVSGQVMYVHKPFAEAMRDQSK